jgi:hypothetical protein
MDGLCWEVGGFGDVRLQKRGFAGAADGDTLHRPAAAIGM